MSVSPPTDLGSSRPSAWSRFLARALTPSFVTGASVFRIVAGGLAFESTLELQSAKTYVVEPFLGITAK